MSFGFKNTKATYQQLINKMFASQISKTIEVYVDNNGALSRFLSMAIDRNLLFFKILKGAKEFN